MDLVTDAHTTKLIAKHGGKIQLIVSIKMIPLGISGIHAQIMDMPIIPMEEIVAHIIPQLGKHPYWLNIKSLQKEPHTMILKELHGFHHHQHLPTDGQ